MNLKKTVVEPTKKAIISQMAQSPRRDRISITAGQDLVSFPATLCAHPLETPLYKGVSKVRSFSNKSTARATNVAGLFVSIKPESVIRQ